MDWCNFNNVTPLPGTCGYLSNLPHVPKFLWAPINARTSNRTFEVDMSLWDPAWGMPAFIAYKRYELGLVLLNDVYQTRMDRAFAKWHPYDYEQDVQSIRRHATANE
jgi:hypothetical protein